MLNAIFDVPSVGITVLCGPGSPDSASATKNPYTVSASSGEVFSTSGTSVCVCPPLNSSVCAIDDDGNPAAFPLAGQIVPVSAGPPTTADGAPAGHWSGSR